MPLPDVPVEVFRKILSFLDVPSLLQAAQVSRSWRHAVDFEPLWEEVARRQGLGNDRIFGAPSPLAWKATLNTRATRLLVLFEESALSGEREAFLTSSALIHGIALQLCPLSETVANPGRARHVMCIAGRRYPPSALTSALASAGLPPCSLFLFSEDCGVDRAKATRDLQRSLPDARMFVAHLHLSEHPATLADFSRFTHRVLQLCSRHVSPAPPSPLSNSSLAAQPLMLPLRTSRGAHLRSGQDSGRGGSAAAAATPSRSTTMRGMLRRVPLLAIVRWIVIPMLAFFFAFFLTFMVPETARTTVAYKPR